MIDRGKYDSFLNAISEIIEKHPKNDDFQKSLAKLLGTRDAFDVKVMFVGHFNAGKSALLNRLINRDNFLEEAQAPQTAIATELRYAEQEKYFAYVFAKDGVECVQMKSQTEYSPEQCDHFEYQLPVEALRQLSDFTIVDTPGFDSGVEQHTKALNAYIGQGSAYILVMDVEDGELTQTSLKFLDEISKYSSRIAVILNKCDKSTESNILEIKEHVLETLRDNGFPCQVATTSKFDDDVPQKVISLVGTFQAQEAFDAQLRRRIIEECGNIRNVLQMTLDNEYIDTYDADKEIQKLEQAKQYLCDSLEVQRKKVEQDNSHKAEDIIEEIRGALLGKSMQIANAIIRGGNSAIEPIIVETVRPIVIDALRQTADSQLNSIVKAVDFSSLLGAKQGQPLQEIITNTAKDLKTLIDTGTFTKALSSLESKEGKGENDGKGSNTGKNIYRVVTGIAAITTSVIAPWLEVVIFLLPDIISLFSKMFGESQFDKARSAFENNVLPQITSRLYEPISNAVEQSQNVLLEAMNKAAAEKLDSLAQSLQEAKEARESKVRNFDEYCDALRTQICCLKEIEEKI